jgi:two-component system, NarL family, invasion response regulator UvrY
MPQINPDKISILIVDDLEYMRKLVQQFLSRNTKVVIVGEADEGEMALQKVKEAHPDVILLDMNLPGMSGVEVAKQVRVDSPECRIYFFSAYDVEDFKNLIDNSLADGFIQKSSLKIELEKMVEFELERKRK